MRGLVVVAAAAVGCLTLAECVPDDSDLVITVFNLTATGYDWSAATIEVTGPDLRHTFTRDDFHSIPGKAHEFSAFSRFSGENTAYVTVHVPGPGTAAPVEAEISFPVRPGVVHVVTLLFAAQRPGSATCGRVGAVVALPASGQGDSLFVLQHVDFRGMPCSQDLSDVFSAP